jgi:hypothetical protein
MFSSNPFTLLSQSIPPLVMQIYVILMILISGPRTFISFKEPGSSITRSSLRKQWPDTRCSGVKPGGPVTITAPIIRSWTTPSGTFSPVRNTMRRRANGA